MQKKLTECGLWYATAPEEELIELMREEPGLMRDWDLVYGDRMQKIVFIGKGMDRAQIERDLDACLEEVEAKISKYATKTITDYCGLGGCGSSGNPGNQLF